MLRAKFLQENISEALEKFEEKVQMIYHLFFFLLSIDFYIQSVN